ncbi:4-hydroxy-tetrahydrodipicolinate synthase [Candidatus Vidania fulgoroideorum]
MFKDNITSLITPFKKNGDIDFNSIKKIVKLQYKSGIKNIVINATTGESCSLSFSEQKKIINFIYNKYKKKIGIIIGSCYNSIKKSFKLINFIKKKKKIKTILQITPYYNNPTKKGIIDFIKKICKKFKKKVILYNVPSRTNINITVKMLNKLFKIKNLIGIKEASSNIKEVIRKIFLCKKKKKLFFFGDDLMYLLLRKKFNIYRNISVATNIIPKDFTKKNNNFKENKKIIDLINVLFIETNPIPIKYLLKKIGMIKGSVRSPLCEPKKKNKKKIMKIFKKYFEK